MFAALVCVRCWYVPFLRTQANVRVNANTKSRFVFVIVPTVGAPRNLTHVCQRISYRFRLLPQIDF